MDSYPLVLVDIDCGWSEESCRSHLPLLPTVIQERAGRYLAPASRRNLVASRSRLREALMALGCDQASVMVADNGRPYYASQCVQFNLSHSHDRAFLAISRDPALLEGLGVDVEWSYREIDAAGIGKRFFTAEESYWIGTDKTRFFHVWTRKEAIIKSNGVGLRVALDSFDVLGDHVGEHVTGRSLFLQTRTREDGYLVSWAVSHRPSRVVILNDQQADWLDRLSAELGQE